jgi:NADPH:quinone reductase-like Zn-dependent oxidoreductase
MAALSALQGLRDKGQIRPGQRVLVNGASGGVGTFAVQIAKSFGADVTAVCRTRNVDLMRSLGADRVIDYASADFTRDGRLYDLILDTVGNHSFADYRRVMSVDGKLVVVGGPKNNRWVGPLASLPAMLLVSRFGSRKMIPMLTRNSTADLTVVSNLLEAGTVTPVIDRSYPLIEAAEAIGYVGQGHSRGKVVLTMGDG